MESKDIISDFNSCTMYVSFTPEKKVLVDIILTNGDIVHLNDPATFTDNDLYDYWYGFKYRGAMFDLNIFDNRFFVASPETKDRYGGAVYAVDAEGSVITSRYATKVKVVLKE